MAQLLAIAVFCFLVVSCQQSSESSTVPGITSLSNLPKVTSQVTGSSLAIGLQTATTGAKLSEVSTLTWDGTKSQAMCFTGEILRNTLSEAAIPDLALCKIGVLEKYGLFTQDYGGIAQYLSSSGLTASGQTRYYKISASKTSGATGPIGSFTMYSCKDTSTQDAYMTATLSSGSSDTFVSMTSISYYAAGSATGRQLATTSGMVNTDGDWTSKMIAYQGISTDTNFSRSAQISISQSEAQASTYGSFWGSTGGTNEAGCFYSAVELLASNSLATLAIGGGVMKHQISVGSSVCSGTTSTIGWDGDLRTNLADATSSSLYATAAYGTIPTLASFGEANVSFSQSTAWDCSAEGGSFTALDISTLEAAAVEELSACQTKFSLSRTQANCQSADVN